LLAIANIRQAINSLSGPNTLAYSTDASLTKKVFCEIDSFLVSQVPHDFRCNLWYFECCKNAKKAVILKQSKLKIIF